MHLAERSVLLIAAPMLSAFDAVFAKDVHGKDINVSADTETVYHHTDVGSLNLFSV